MRALGCFFIFIDLFFIISSSIVIIKVEGDNISRRTLAIKPSNTVPDDYMVEVDPNLKFENPRLKKAYFAFQEWKKAMYSDPSNFTGNWVGPDVCSYQGVFCAYALDDPNIVTVALIDLNYADIAGYLVPQLSLLTDLGLLHLHSNRFFGIIPESFSKLKLMFEFDVSNNHFVGSFPMAVMGMPNLNFIDLRYNEFEGALPPELFDKEIDAIIVNNNRFHSSLPDNMGNSPASTLVFSNNKFSGCIPKSFVNMPNLEQISLANNRITGCIPEEIGLLKRLIVLDLSRNSIIGSLPKSLEKLDLIESFDFSSNRLTGKVQESICSLPALSNFSISSNYFNEIGAECEKLSKDKLLLIDEDNCFPMRPNQKSKKVCYSMVNRPVDCKNVVGCQSQKNNGINKGNQKLPPKVTTAPPKPKPKPPPALPPPKTPVKPPSPPAGAVTSPPPPPTFKDLILPPNIGSRYSSPPPPVFQGS